MIMSYSSTFSLIENPIGDISKWTAWWEHQQSETHTYLHVFSSLVVPITFLYGNTWHFLIRLNTDIAYSFVFSKFSMNLTWMCVLLF